MSVTATLRDALRAAPTVTTLVEQRTFRDQRPQGSSLDAIVILLISDPRPMAFDGPQSLRRSRVQIDCLSTSRGGADDLAEVVITLVNGRALRGTGKIESVRVDNVRNDTSRDPDATTFRTAIDVMVWHSST